MTIAQRITREPTLVLGLATAALSLAVLFGADISAEQIAGVGVFLGALMALVRYLTVPAAEVVVQEKPSGEVIAGKASDLTTGLAVEAEVMPVVAPPAVRAEIRRRREAAADD